MGLFMKIRANCSIALCMVVATLVGSAAYQAGEVDAVAYRFLANAYEDADAADRKAIRAAADAGPISRWDYAGIAHTLIAKSQVLLYERNDLGTIEQERLKLKEKTRHGA